ncbi:DNA cytosine methyltransferase [Actinotignum sp. GS-2025c]|uniref:DNA cytosine methyltransferase n=1 Tax=Actinotignum sp. GS-2025c TaxID=3427276 RepID=UPI003F451178
MRIVDLFCGAGGLSSGARAAGFDIAVSVDNWKCALNVLRTNTSTPVEELDLTDVDNSVGLAKEFDPDMIIGGPPCQDFSRAGHGIEGDRAILTVRYAQTVARVHPEFFLMENVPNAQRSEAYQEATRILTSSGYHLSECVLDASYFGVPQHRSRLVVIGTLRDDLKDPLEEIHAQETIFPTTVRDYWPDVPFNHYYRHPRTYARRAVFSVDEPSPTIRGVNRPRPATYKPHPGDSTQESNVYALTSRERARIQTFPTTFQWNGSRDEIDQMVGNAVPVELSKRIFTGLKSWIEQPEQEHLSFRSWLARTHEISPRGCGDVLSRLRRAYKNIPVGLREDWLTNDDALEKAINLSPVSVQSQVRRAVTLYREYTAENTGKKARKA